MNYSQLFENSDGSLASFRARYSWLQLRLLDVVAVLEVLPEDDFRVELAQAKFDRIAEAFDADCAARGLEGPSARDVLLTMLPLDVDDPRYDELELLKLELPTLERNNGPWLPGLG